MTDPSLHFYGEPRRFLRFVFEFEIEVTDPTAAAAYTMDVGRDENGELGMVTTSNQNQQMAATVQQVIAHALHTQGPQAGFRWLSGSVLPRRVGDDGQHAEMTLSAMPARGEDGELP